MYNLGFDNPYNREIVKKLRGFRNKQQGFFVPTDIEPEHIVHHYDPITITGGSINHISHPIRPGALIHYPPDLFQPIHTINRNQMVGNRIQGGSSDLMREPYQIPTDYRSGVASYDSDSDIDDLGAVHSKRRGQKGMVGSGKGNERKIHRIVVIPETDNKLPKPVLEKLRRIKEVGSGKKSKNLPEPKHSSKLLKIFN
jgi:hypothetical protein